MNTWLPFIVKTIGTVYLLEAPGLLVLRTIVLMFVPSKIDWMEPFHGFPMRTWAVVLALAAATHLLSGIVGWIVGVRLARRQPGAMYAWRILVSWLLIQHLAWLIWVFLTLQSEDRFLLFYLGQGVVLLVLGVYSWLANP